ncbi:chemotaxis protein CheB [Halochromatium salexigens]|uniref:chemotaxis protein CheB n=1 Tax=Halochromatium salexigens TaxID=49447 RepID=UPI00191271CD
MASKEDSTAGDAEAPASPADNAEAPASPADSAEAPASPADNAEAQASLADNAEEPTTTAADNDAHETPSAPVVGIGASAGGLEAFKALLQALPEDTGMAFLLVQHLAPTRESLLSEIMARETNLPVREAEDGAWIAPNHIYVAPPDHSLAVRAGRLQLTQGSSREHAGSEHGELPIDFMLRSLAEEAGPAAVGVVLSGTASDGTLGLKAIKAAGGMTFAQDEDSAQYFGMPGNAIASGAVDFVLPPAEIARELGRIARHPYLLDRGGRTEGEEDPGASTDQMTQVFRLLRARTGHDFSYYKHATIKRRLKRRMLLSKLDRFRDYLEYLRSEPNEVDALFHDITINVTGFFREQKTFDALRDSVLPTLLKRRSANETLRIWVPGCSTGEEPYSLAMVLLEALGSQPSIPVQIFGTDIDEQAIERARSGIYPSRISGEISQGRLNRFFHEVSAGWQINKSVRGLCVFAPHNVASDPPFSRLDLICCRNLMIYLGSTLQRRVLQIFHYALKPGGFLLLGASEGIGSSSDLFRLEDKEAKSYAKQSTSSTPTYELAPARRETDREPQGDPHEPSGRSESEIRKEADRAVLTLFSPPGVIVTRDLTVMSFRGKTGRYLEPLPGTASLDLVKLIRQEILVDLRNLFKRALKSDEPVLKTGIELKVDGPRSELSLRVIPLAKDAPERFYLILFEEHPVHGVESGSAPASASHGAQEDKERDSKERDSDADQARIAKLEKELEETREYMQSIIEDQESTNEELQSANEEVQSTNEELQSTNEELETAKEELQSTNEELATVNDELEHRNAELTSTNNDLRNLLSSVNLPILMLDRDLRVRQFTPRAKRLFNLIEGDVGRPIGNLRPNIDLPRLERLAHEVMESMAVKRFETESENGKTQDVTLRPYRTHDQRIDGVVITLFDRDQPTP